MSSVIVVAAALAVTPKVCECSVGSGAGPGNATADTRKEWVAFAEKLARPVLSPMAEGRLTEAYNYENGALELSPTWDGRSKRVAYLEMFGRLMDGIAPWLALPDDDTSEGALRRGLRTLALKACANAVDPASPDYLGWDQGAQTLVDSAFLAEGFLRAWNALWIPLDETVKSRYIAEYEKLRRYTPCYSNWLLFSSINECFLLKAGGKADSYRLRTGLNKTEEWYVGDGWYSDGPAFSFDYYNSYVIQPMYYTCTQTLIEKKRGTVGRIADIEKRMQRYAVILERLISPEGTYPVIGRSIPYRMAALQPLALLALEKKLPQELPEGQVRAALDAVRRRMFSDDRNFNRAGFLTLGFNGPYPEASDYYTNNGSLYMTSLFLLPLGLPASDSFWTSPAEPWTQQKAWGGDPFPKDHRWRIPRQHPED